MVPHGKIKDITGFVFERITVVSFSHVNNESAFWNCICSCGKKKVINGNGLRKGVIKSRGCLNRELSAKRSFKHGGSLHRKTWNKYYPENPIRPGDGYVIHHKDGNHFNNNIDNLQKK